MEEKIKYTEILLPSEEPFLNYLVGEPKSTFLLSSINIFIGTNNCGKSRLLRSIFSLSDFLYNTNKYSNKQFCNFLERFNNEFKDAFKDGIFAVEGIGFNYIEEILSSQNKDFICSREPIFKIAFKLLNDLSNLKDRFEGLYPTQHFEINYKDEQLIHRTYDEIIGSRDAITIFGIIEVVNKFNKEFDDIITYFKKLNIDLLNDNLNNENRYYIPILRGMRPLNIDNQHLNLYADRTREDYFKKDTLAQNMKIFTGLELYQTLKEKLLGEPDERKLVKEFEDFLSINFFENKPVTLIPKEKSPKVVHIKIGNEPQYPIYELGDGLQNLIICTFNIFMEKETRCLFFIEEPDMFMHPSMQRSFLEVLSKYDQHQYFITSHSNHFLDMTIDFANISVFHFSKHEDSKPQHHIRPSSPHDRQILLDLGVRNSSVFITNATIWVEGITDRLYLKAYMKKYIDELERSDPQKYRQLIKLKEDYHYSFVEYQGANLTHWNFDPDDDDTYNMKASYICAQAFLIADGDIGSEIKGNRKAIYEEMLGNRFLALHVKEIENLIPAEVLRQVVAKQFKKYGGNTDLIQYQDYARLDTPIGSYLDNLLPLSTNSLFAAESGTFTSYYKGTVCDNAVKIMKNLEWALTDDLKAICEKIFDHIITQNKNS
ncbi:AAA family ATPase [Pseudanabaena sp. FACHB-1998]|uniref:AAA family ATPase n=1 Tax=Pseudanabaena sp. FACHB-1998 TaxID=2692858 RepID=UPI00168100B6|nr:AAA family ATPase [Pseudanabaena sp. FACHB-1998]MBD2176150.1 AAA family ATPase [Pseudanabaena sp. FACHB-1998]